MSNLATLRNLISPSNEPTFVGNVLVVEDNGVVSVLSGAKVVPCFSSIKLVAGDRVRVQGVVVVSKIANVDSDVQVYRV